MLDCLYAVKDAISYNCFSTIMKVHFVVKKCFISRHQIAQLLFWVLLLVYLTSLLNRQSLEATDKVLGNETKDESAPDLNTPGFEISNFTFKKKDWKFR